MGRAEIRVRAERKVGELLTEGKKTGMVSGKGGNGSNQHREQTSERPTIAPKLEEMGISYDQSSKWQKLAAIPKAKFEDALAAACS